MRGRSACAHVVRQRAYSAPPSPSSAQVLCSCTGDVAYTDMLELKTEQLAAVEALLTKASASADKVQKDMQTLRREMRLPSAAPPAALAPGAPLTGSAVGSGAGWGRPARAMHCWRGRAGHMAPPRRPASPGYDRCMSWERSCRQAWGMWSAQVLHVLRLWGLWRTMSTRARHLFGQQRTA